MESKEIEMFIKRIYAMCKTGLEKLEEIEDTLRRIQADVSSGFHEWDEDDFRDW